MARFSSLIIVICVCAGCAKTDLRGSYRPSHDGMTYLIVDDDNGGQCGPIRVDGKIWPQPVGHAGRIEPGHHPIGCGGIIDFDIRPGVIYKFDDWGAVVLLRV